jgi:tripartite-type tricarboxylate transporter receptor subunit TctC
LLEGCHRGVPKSRTLQWAALALSAGVPASLFAIVRPRALARQRFGTIMKLPRRKFLQLAASAAALPAISRIAVAQNYPTRPIRLVVPFPPGGAFDALGRPWAEKMKPLLGTVFVENIGGSGASLGAAAVARARPDGYTILLGGTLPHVNEALLKNRPLYDPVKDLDPIVAVAANFIGIAVNPSVPAQTLEELIAYAKANPGKLSYGHAGIGSTNHLTGELFKLLAGTPEIVQVPYRGMGPALTDAIGGQIQMAVPGITGQVLEFHRTGRLRVLAVTSPKRLTAAPEIPTAAEAGLPGLTVTASLGLLAPSGTPTAVIEQIAQATRTALAEHAYRQSLIEGGFEPALDSNPEKFRQSLAADVALWAPVVKSLGLKID